MTNPQGPQEQGDSGKGPGDDAWARPAEPRPLPPTSPLDGATEGYTQQPPPPPPQYPPSDVTYPAPATTPPSDVPAPPQPPRSRGPFGVVIAALTSSAALVVIIVVSLFIAGVVAVEIYARNRADSVVAGVVKCVVEDDAEVSFGPRPFLWQHLTKNYDDLSITTAGNNIRDAKGMKLQLQLDNIELNETADSAGTVGSLQANITWSTEGIKQSVQDITLIGRFINDVKTNPSDGTIELVADLLIGTGTIIAKPEIVNGGLQLTVTELSGLGLVLPSEAVQPALDAFTSSLTSDYPMGIQAQGVEVTEEGVNSQFGAQNATIPRSGDNPCFEGL